MQRMERTPVNMMDLFPTLLDLANLPLPPGVTLDGLSMRPLLEGRQNGELHNVCIIGGERLIRYPLRPA